MRLKRIDAVRFGALEGSCLPDLGDGLTVVLGPNESGKSTYTALVRGVLFGFPLRGKAGDRSYRTPAGERAGRLTFADATGEWAIDRIGEKKGGAYAVSALRGPERPELLTELLGDLAEQTYKVVFGFGIDELDDIEHGDDKYLAGRLFAAGTGMEVNPLDVRAALDKEASELFSPRARVATVNALVSQMKEVRDTIRGLEAESATFAEEQSRAVLLAAELEPVRSRRDELERQVRALERDAQRVQDLSVVIGDLTEALGELERAVAEHARRASAATVDERVLAVADELSAVLEEASGFRRSLDALRAAESAAVEAHGRVDELGDLHGGAADSLENRAKVEEWATRRAGLAGELQAAERAADSAEARALEFEAASRPPDVSRPPVAAWAAIALGVVFVAAGAIAGQMLAAALGGAVAIAGFVLLAVRPRSASDGLGAEASRAGAEAKAAREVAARVAASIETGGDAWRGWLSDRALQSAGDDPAAVRALLDRLRARDEFRLQAARLEAQAARERLEAEAWAARVIALSTSFLDTPDGVALDEVTIVAARAKEAIDKARAAADVRSRELDAQAAASAELDRLRGKLDVQRAELAATLAPYRLEPEGAGPQLQVLTTEAAAGLAEIRDEVDERAKALAMLRGRLDSEGRDAAMAIARQKLEGLRAAATAEARRYTVTALSVRLLDRARERFERERQPEVARVAGRVFAAMTGGRYADVRVPLDGSVISVVTSSGALKPSGELSRGTAEQLYLALRMGFLKSLQSGRALPVLMDDVVVNFDATRRAGAAAAIAELAADRQVIFFTCHEETAAVLAEAAPGRTLVVLDRCELKG